MENDENSRFSQHVSFEKHIRKGEWDAANQFINSNPEVVTEKISISGSTALHIAIFEGHEYCGGVGKDNVGRKLKNKKFK